MKLKIIGTLLIVSMCILLADHFLLKEDIHVNASYDQSQAWSYIVEHQDEYPSSLLKLACRNKETIPFVANYITERKKNVSMNVQDDLKEKTIPLFLQWDQRWGYKEYGNDLMAINGCGPTCLSMVVSYLKQDGQYHPYYIAQFAIENGYFNGEDTLWTLMNQGAKKLGLKVKELSLSEANIQQELEAGHPIICSMSKGIFTSTGHFIVLTEYKNGKISVHDPNSQEKSEKEYAFKDIQYQIKNLWSYSLD